MEIKELLRNVPIFVLVTFLSLELGWAEELRDSAAQPMELGELFELALSRYKPTRIARKELKLAKMKRRQAIRELLPSVAGQFELAEGSVAGGDYRGKRYGLELEQPIFQGGKLPAKIRQARLELKIAKKSLEKISRDLYLELAEAYYGLAGAELAHKAFQKLDQESLTLCELAEKEYRQGLIPLLEYSSVKALGNEAKFKLAAREYQLKLAELALRSAVNAEPWEALQVNTSLLPKRIYLNLWDCLNMAYENRPELAIARLKVARAKEVRASARAEGLPHVSLVGALGRGGEFLEAHEVAPKDEWSLGLNVKWSMFGNTVGYSYAKERRAPIVSTAQSLTSKVHSFKVSLLDDLDFFCKRKEAEIEHERSLLGEEETVEGIMREVNEAYYNYKRSLVQLEAARSGVEFKRLEVEILMDRLKRNKVLISEVLKAKTELTNREVMYLEALARNNLAAVYLNKGVGYDVADIK